MDRTNRLISGELLPESANLTLLDVHVSDQGWTVEAVGGSYANCPQCGTRSTSRHSRYICKLQDLPVQGSPTVLCMQASKWRCRNRRCTRKVFSEHIPKAMEPRARRTSRLREVVCLIGHGMDGRPGERLISRLGMPVSDDTILREVKRASSAPSAAPLRVVGIDDWAWKKGQTYGTILGSSSNLVTKSAASLHIFQAAQVWSCGRDHAQPQQIELGSFVH